MKKLDEGLAVAESWTVSEWSSFAFLDQIQGSVRQIVAMGREMFIFLDRIPYLIARLAEPGVAARALEQFDSTPESAQNRSSVAVFSREQPSLRADVLAIKADGSGLSLRLQAEVDSLNEINCDDTIDEAPHSIFNRIVAAARRGLFAWQASSLRLEQNMWDARNLPSAVDVDPQQVWNKYSCILQVKKRSLAKPVRCNRKCLEERVYTLMSMDKFHHDGEAGADVASDDSDPDIDAAPVVAPPLKKSRSSVDIVAVPDADIDPDPNSTRLMAEWLVYVMQRYIFIVVAVENPAPLEDTTFAFQILSIKPKQALVKTFQDACPHRYGLRATIQPLSQWRGSEITADSTEICYVIVDGPRDVDLFKVCGSHPDCRLAMLQAFRIESDLDGTDCIAHFAPLEVSCSLKDEHIPIICLLDELERQEFVGRDSIVIHTSRSGMFYDRRNAPGRRAYFQCVLASASLFAKGVRKFVSNKSNAYYMLLLRSPGPVPDTLSADECNKKLKSMIGEWLAPAVLACQPRSRPAQVALDDASVDGDDGDEGPVAGRVSAATTPDLEFPDSDSSSSNSSSSSSSGGSVDGDGVDGDDYPSEILGSHVVIEHHKSGKDYGLRVACRNPDHVGCKKYRSVRKDVQQFGLQAPAIFLRVWLEKAFSMEPDEHHNYIPSRKDQREHLLAEQAE